MSKFLERIRLGVRATTPGFWFVTLPLFIAPWSAYFWWRGFDLVGPALGIVTTAVLFILFYSEDEP